MSDNCVPNEVFIRKINSKTVSQSLVDTFKRFGEVTSARIITKWRFGHVYSLRFGFVEFSTPAAAVAAISSSEPIIVDGCMLSLRTALPRFQYKRDTIFVSSIPTGTTKDDIKAYFAKYNPIAVRIVRMNSRDTPGVRIRTVRYRRTPDSGLPREPPVQLPWRTIACAVRASHIGLDGAIV
jgi:RNA recognition motif-containing protein